MLSLKSARFLLLLALLAYVSTTMAQSTSDAELTAAVAQLRAGGQGNAVAQPFEAATHAATSFVNDARTATAATSATTAQPTVSDFQNAGFNADDAQRIVASLGAVGSASTDIAVVAMTATTTAPPTTESTTTTASTPTATMESATPTPVAVTEESTLAPQLVTTQTPALTAVPEATAVAAEAESSTAAPATLTATAFSANTAAGDSSQGSGSDDGVGAVTLLAGGVGCVLAVAVVATALRRKILRPKTPGTPPESRAAYFHCEKRLTPPLEMA